MLFQSFRWVQTKLWQKLLIWGLLDNFAFNSCTTSFLLSLSLSLHLSNGLLELLWFYFKDDFISVCVDLSIPHNQCDWTMRAFQLAKWQTKTTLIECWIRYGINHFFFPFNGDIRFCQLEFYIEIDRWAKRYISHIDWQELIVHRKPQCQRARVRERERKIKLNTFDEHVESIRTNWRARNWWLSIVRYCVWAMFYHCVCTVYSTLIRAAQHKLTNELLP